MRALIDHLLAPHSLLPASLLRIVLVLILWSRFADQLLPFRFDSLNEVLLSALFFTSSGWMLLGFGGRAGSLACALVVDYLTFGLGRGTVEEWGHHHTTVLAYAITYTALADNTAWFSVDRWLETRAAPPSVPRRGARWPLVLLGMQISTVYFWSAFDKSSAPFLSGARLIQDFVHVWWTSDWAPSPGIRMLAAAVACFVVALEYILPFGLWVPRVRGLFVLAGIVLHTLFYVLLPVSTFSVTMVACYLAFVDGDAVERWFARQLGPPTER